MKLDTIKLMAGKLLPVVPILIGALLGIGGTKAMDTIAKPTAGPVLVEVTCKPSVTIAKPDPIRVEFIRK